MNSEYRDASKFTAAIQAIFPKLMHYLSTEENRELTGLGITPGQINALLVIYFNDNLTMGELSSEIYLAESAATRLVNRLVNLNLVKRRGDDKDRRLVRVTLTNYGRQLSKLVFERRSYRFNNLARRLSPDERENLVVSLQTVMRVFEELEKDRQRSNNHPGRNGQ
ncbi:MAG: MarR family transcriptional regulator [Firmicutes bacterium ML8_F2]|jgi:MarR family transcriptional regulator, organic hydroperoxide resistance regulator|nr:MAG: MarR family transcriptional regulator [Firmicutes bacterium ML8_F2]